MMMKISKFILVIALLSSFVSASSCLDSDGGKDYYANGFGYDNIKYFKDKPVYDSCHPENSMILREVICTDKGYVNNPEYLCPNGCKNGACISKPIELCTVEVVKCENNNLYKCYDSSIGWANVEYCNYGCDFTNKQCNPKPTILCDQDQLKCEGNEVYKCYNSSMGWMKVESCQTGCGDGMCSYESTNTTNYTSPKQCFGSTIPLKVVCSKGMCHNEVDFEKETCENIVETKNKITLIINKKGIYANPDLEQIFIKFLDSIKIDLNIDNVGITYFDGNTKEEIKYLTDFSYCQKEVGYIIFIGDDLLNITAWAVNDDNLSFLQNELSIYGFKDSQNRVCKDIAISIITPPIKYSDKEKIEYVRRVISTYTKYHLNENNILSETKGHLHIEWDPKLPSYIGEPGISHNISFYPNDVISNKTIFIYNSNTSKVIKELKKKPAELSYNVHGAPTVVTIGLNPYEQNGSEAIYTSIDEFKSFYFNQTPPLIIAPLACESWTLKYDESYNCCMPQTFMGLGVWAQATLSFSKGVITNLTPFVGYVMRHRKLMDNTVYGDVTAHLFLEDISDTIPQPIIVKSQDSERITNNQDCNGCQVEDKCIPISVRIDKNYCDIDKQLKEQIEKESCNNNFECMSNLCINNECITPSAWKKILSWFGI